MKARKWTKEGEISPISTTPADYKEMGNRTAWEIRGGLLNLSGGRVHREREEKESMGE